MAKDKKLKHPSMLAFDRKLEVSDALMHAGNWEHRNSAEQWQPIEVVSRNNRSTQSAFGIKDADKEKPNPVASDSDDANLPHDCDTLKVSFTVRIIGNIGNPFGCNDPEFEHAIHEKVGEFKETGLKELAHRYAHNIASGRFLWRNRVCAEELLVVVTVNRAEHPISFDGYEIALNDFSSSRANKEVEELATAIFTGLNGEDEFSFIEIDAFVKLGGGQHVFPSQEMNMGEKRKVLFKLGKNSCAAMHSVKVGNAIRTIDDWYAQDAEFPIAVEPFGSVTQRGAAYRKKKNDLYTLMMDWVNEKPIIDEDKYFVLANLVRGGVFGGKSE